MTPVDKLAAVVEELRKKQDNVWDFYSLTQALDLIEPILAELQRAQGRIGTMGEAKALYDEGFVDGQRAQGREREALERIASMTCGCMSQTDDNWHHDKCWKNIALNALLSAPTPATCPNCAKLEKTILFQRAALEVWKSGKAPGLEGMRAQALDAERLAQQFHETYERLAPQFGYETRKASAKPWAEVPEQNKKLMIAVCDELQRAQGQTRLDEARWWIKHLEDHGDEILESDRARIEELEAALLSAPTPAEDADKQRALPHLYPPNRKSAK